MKHEAVYLTTCTECCNVYIDTNHGDESVEYSDGLIRLFGLKEIELMEDDGGLFRGCPECKTDEHLADNVVPCGGMSEEMYCYLYE